MGLQSENRVRTIVEEEVFKLSPQLSSHEFVEIIYDLNFINSSGNPTEIFLRKFELTSIKTNGLDINLPTTIWLANEIPWSQLIGIDYNVSKNLFIQMPEDYSKLLNILQSRLKVIKNEISFNQKTLKLREENTKLIQDTTKIENDYNSVTRVVHDLKAQEVHRSKRIKDLVQFIKELILVESNDDFLTLIRREFKKFHNVLAPIFLNYVDKEHAILYFFQGKQILNKKIKLPDLNLNDLDPKNEKSRHLLLEWLQRPIANVLALPLAYQEKKIGILFFENQLSPDQMKEFIHTLAERTYPLEATLDRLVQQDDINRISLLWAKTFDDLEDPVLIVEENFNIVRSNKSFGLLKDKKCYEIFAQSDKPCVGCPIVKNENATGLVSANQKIYEVNSSQFSFEARKSERHYIHHYRDVTKSKELQGRVIQGEKMAAIGLLAGNIAHELNNPLTGIKSMAEIVRKEVKPEETIFNDLGEIVNASERCHRIIQNLLDFSKDSKGIKSFSEVDLNQVINKTLPLLKTAMRFHNCELNLTDENTLVLANPYLLQQVVFNLVNNACQAMGDSGNLIIKTQCHEEVVELHVIDDGPGVPEDIKKAIFDPFFTTKSKDEGTGLGLSMSLSVIESFNGKLYLNKKEGTGADFVISLPLVKK